MPQILDFPQRFALLVRRWDIAHTSQALARAIDLPTHTLSRWVSGDTRKMSNRLSDAKVAERLANYLEAEGILSARGYSYPFFLQVFLSPNDFEFLDSFIAASPAGQMGRAGSECGLGFHERKLIETEFLGNSLLYRIGFETEKMVERRKITYSFRPVLRQLPICFRAASQGNLVFHFTGSDGLRGVSSDIFGGNGVIGVTGFEASGNGVPFALEVMPSSSLSKELDAMALIGFLITQSDTESSSLTASKVVVTRLRGEVLEYSWDKFSSDFYRNVDLMESGAGRFHVIQEADQLQIIADAISEKTDVV